MKNFMELIVKQEHLSKALNIIGKVANTKTSISLLGTILLRTNGNQLLIAANNLELAVSQNISAKIKLTGSIAIPSKLITEFIASLPKGDVLLKVENNHLYIESGNYKSKINGESAEEFPDLPTIEEETNRISFSTDEFKNIVSQTVFTCSNDTARPVLTGVYWHDYEEYLYLASTDGYRLSERKVKKIEKPLSAIIPSSALQEVLRSVYESVDEIETIFDDHKVEFKVGDIIIVSRLIDGKFVDYRRLIPSSTETVVEIKKNDFMRIVKIASLFARDSGGSVTIEVNEDESKISIHSIASEFGENTSEASVTVTGGGKITLNSRYITECLNNINGDDIIFGFSGRLAPTVFKPLKDKNYIHIIMPLKS